MKKIEHYIAGWRAAEKAFGKDATPQANIETAFVNERFARESAALAAEMERLKSARELEYKRIDAIHKKR